MLAGFFFLDKDAANDSTPKRRSTLINAHNRLQLFTGRNDPAGREEQFERFYLVLLDASPASVVLRPFAVGQPEIELTFNQIIDDMLKLASQRNPDFYEFVDGELMRAS